MATSEIEKLERRYAENPQGLTFAPLAEVHRKNGDLGRALELLTAGLELHPNYIPASIVLGRCHQDLGDLPAAEAAFAHVLRLDDENVIALKCLADINERLERYGDAEGWLRRLVAVDRSNEEAREQLLRVEAAKNGELEAGRSSSELGDLDLEPVDIAAPDLPEAAGSTESQAAVPPAEPEPAPPPLAVERAAVPHEETVPELSRTSEPDEVSREPVEPMAGLISSEFETPKEIAATPRETLGIDVETSAEVVLEGSGSSEFRVPDASEDFRSLAAKLPAGPEAPMEELPEPPPSGPEPETQSVAQAQSVADFFRAMLAARPPSEPGSPGAARAASSPEGGAPTRPAQDGLSLSSVFGEESSPVPPAVSGPEQKTEAGVSFDDFFNPKTEGSSSGAEDTDSGKDDLDQFHSWLQNLKR
ncbi:MAG: tetratricopeptide repeat protein [Gemmatimonadales bacterium]